VGFYMIGGILGLVGDLNFWAVLSYGLVIGVIMMVADVWEDFSTMNPHDILECINKRRKGWEKFSELSEIEKLEKAYSLASDRAKESFKVFLTGWLLNGFGAFTLWYSVMNGKLAYNSATKLTLFVSPILGLALFVLMIVAYLKHREYEKALFAIQLKKSDRTEISIFLNPKACLFPNLVQCQGENIIDSRRLKRPRK